MSEITTITVAGIDIPVKVYKERRSNRRVSLGKTCVNLRVPSIGARLAMPMYLGWVKDWLIQLEKTRPELLERFQVKPYQTGDLVHIYDKSYELVIAKEHRKTSTGRVRGERLIQLKLATGMSARDDYDVAHKLIRRIVANDNLATVEQRIRALNEQHFQKKIKSVKLKYNTSNWGSCSNTGNINISTRLLCAPYDVRDYVYIHELAHLIELNHSRRFWAIVEGADPSYKQKEHWLRKHNHECVI